MRLLRARPDVDPLIRDSRKAIAALTDLTKTLVEFTEDLEEVVEEREANNGDR